MRVVEIFESIQGEGCHMGEWVTFIRFAGCNLDCPFCDEKYKYDKAIDMTPEDVAKKVNPNVKKVILTGGEPTLQPDLYNLCTLLHKKDHFICIETNGTRKVPDVVDWVTCSPKEPKYECNTRFDELKIVVTEDLQWFAIWDLIWEYANKGEPVWLQPCDGPYIEESKKKIAAWCSQYKGTNIRAGIQLHKYYDLT